MKNSALNKQFDPLEDGISLVEYVDHMGNDASVVRSARVSYAKDKTPFDPEKDRKLIQYLLDNNHGTPFEANSITLNITLPIYIARQWIRHRVGVSFNEMSLRYTEATDNFYIPKQLYYQDKKNRQGSAEPLSDAANDACIKQIQQNSIESMGNYRFLLASGCSKEHARIVLPVNLYTRWYFTFNLRSIMHWYGLRADLHAQLEIRKYTDSISEIMRELFPISWSLFLEKFK